MDKNGERLHGLDAVRAFALLLGIVLHATMSFVPVFTAAGWPIVDSSPSVVLQGTFFVIHVFRMTTFFVIAGFFAHLLFHRRGTAGFIKDRSRRVLVPLVVGWLILAPITLGILFWAAASGTRPPVTSPPPTPTLFFPLTHLWFLYVLALLYVTVLTLRHLMVTYVDRGAVRSRLDMSIAAIVRWPVAPLVLAIPVTIALYAHAAWLPFGGIPTPDLSLIPNLPAFVAYLTAFCFGWLLHRQSSLLAAIQRSWPGYLVAAIALTALAMALLEPIGGYAVGRSQGPLRFAYAATYGVASWCWTFGIMGAALRFLSTERPMVRYLADSSYWLYLLHLPLIFGLQQVVSDWPLHWSVKFPLLLAVATALLLVSYHWLVRRTYIGEVLNGRRYPRGVTEVEPTHSSGQVASVVTSSSQPLATLRSVHKRYGVTVALDGFDLEIGPGELLAVLGPNGAGKTTAIELLLGLQQPDSGSAILFGGSPSSLEGRRRTGVMMQEVTLAAELRVHEMLALTASYYAAPMTPQAAMEITHTTALAQRPYGKLSGGQKRQVQFALAICGRPQLLFLDEPTVGLDIRAREVMWQTIRELVRAGCSIVLTTHYLEEAEALADRVVVVARGKVIASGSVNDVRALVSRRHIGCVTRTPATEVAAWPEVDSVTHEHGRLQITTASAEVVVRKLLAADTDLSELEVRRAGLSEAFSELTQEAA